MDPDEIKEIFDDSMHVGDTVLRALLAAHLQSCAERYFAAAEHIERAIYSFRDVERGNLLYKLQMEARKRIAPPSREDKSV